MSKVPAINTVSMRGLQDAIRTAVASGVSLVVLGGPGIGKTASARAVSESLRLNLYEGNAMLMLPEDLRGVQFVNKEHTHSVALRPKWLPSEDDTKAVVVMDDFTNAVPAMQQASYGLALEKCAGEHRMHPNTTVILFGNRPEDKSGAINVNPVLANRCTVLYFEGPTWQEWEEYAEANSIHHDIRAYLAMNPDRLNAFDGTRVCNPTPRSWELGSRVLFNCPVNRTKSFLAGVVGTEDALKMEAMRNIMGKVPSWEEILEDPSNAKLPDPEKRDAVYYVCGSLATRVDDKTLDRAWDYIKRLDPEYRVVIIKLAQERLQSRLASCIGTMRKVMSDPAIKAALNGK